LRLPERPDRFLVKGRGYKIDALAAMKPEEMVTCDLEGNLVDGPPGATQCFEVKMHSCIYRARPDVQSVVHVHPQYTVTMSVLGAAIVLVLAIAVPLGMAVAILTRGGRNRWLDAGFNFVTSLIYSVPQYVVATLLVVVFAVTLRWFPAAGAATLNSLVLPTAALMLGPACVISRIVRRETAAVLEKDYIRTARGWRLGVLRTNARYVLPNLVTTTLTLSGLILAAQLGGAVVIETVFAWPGLGQGIVNAILQRDYPVIRGIILVLGLLATLIIILVDLILAIIDPRNLGGTTHDV